VAVRQPFILVDGVLSVKAERLEVRISVNLLLSNSREAVNHFSLGGV